MTTSEIIGGLIAGTHSIFIDEVDNDKLGPIIDKAFPTDKGVLHGSKGWYVRKMRNTEGEFIESSEPLTTIQVKLSGITNNPKAIIGYKLSKRKYQKAAEDIATVSLDNELGAAGYNFAKGSPVHTLIKEAGVLDLWFEPVYQSHEMKLHLGTPSVSITIRKGSITAKKEAFDYNVILQIQEKMKMNIVINDYNVTLPNVAIGCTTFTKDEIDNIVETYKKLN